MRRVAATESSRWMAHRVACFTHSLCMVFQLGATFPPKAERCFYIILGMELSDDGWQRLSAGQAMVFYALRLSAFFFLLCYYWQA